MYNFNKQNQLTWDIKPETNNLEHDTNFSSDLQVPGVRGHDHLECINPRDPSQKAKTL